MSVNSRQILDQQSVFRFLLIFSCLFLVVYVGYIIKAFSFVYILEEIGVVILVGFCCIYCSKLSVFSGF